MSQAAVKIQTASPMLSVNNIEVVYDEVIQVLRGVTLDLPEVELVTLLSPNGEVK
jgi:branched-chain amino acid transport system ATP-binding protein